MTIHDGEMITYSQAAQESDSGLLLCAGSIFRLAHVDTITLRC